MAEQTTKEMNEQINEKKFKGNLLLLHTYTAMLVSQARRRCFPTQNTGFLSGDLKAAEVPETPKGWLICHTKKGCDIRTLGVKRTF